METETTSSGLPLVGAAGVGAALMYLLDPERGERRRHLVQDRINHVRHRLGDGVGRTRRDLRNQARGLGATVRRPFRGDGADDIVVTERVRAELGRLVSHPGAVEVSTVGGSVTLGGPVLADEADRLLAGVRAVRGVTGVQDALERHDAPGDVPGLQGVSRKPARRFELMQENWSPATRLLTGIAGGALAASGLAGRRSGPLQAALGAVGLALFARAAMNRPTRELTGVGAGRDVIEIRKSIAIAASVDEVFAWFTEWQRWPEWMSHVREVTPSGEAGAVGQRTHWVVDGLAGTTVRWDAEVTRIVPGEVVSWKTVDGSAIEHTGTIRFERAADDLTRVHIRMSYNPVAGALGHAVATLLGRDPKHQMDQDLVRLKTTIEEGRVPRDAARA